MEKILWHRRESRRKTEKTNIFLQPREAPAYSNHGEYTLFSANIFVGLRACIESLKMLEIFRISERKVDFFKEIDG
jgi:hypothetical protein